MKCQMNDLTADDYDVGGDCLVDVKTPIHDHNDGREYYICGAHYDLFKEHRNPEFNLACPCCGSIIFVN